MVSNAITPSPHTVITTHINADFDALASMLAAQKLYPEAMVVFPGAQEKNLRNFFVQSMVYLLNLAEIKDIHLQGINKLVLVDTRRKNRIGPLSRILKNPELTIHTYDHHPIKEDDIRGQKEVYRATGATVTILTEFIRQRKIEISPEEATIMCLGIYEDTGGFTFPSTTAEDLQAAAFLVAKGANINVIASLIARDISAEQVRMLNDLIQSLHRINVNGVDISIATAAYDTYMPDFAFLVHKLAKMEHINAVFVLAMMENKVYIVARSRTTDVDVGAILDELGGGGHPYAASAAIREQTLAQVEQQLIECLYRRIKSRRLARHLMTSPPIMAPQNTSCADAQQMLTRYNINALLVVDANGPPPQLKGFITRQVIEKAIYHHLGHVPIADYMNTELAVVQSSAGLEEVQNKIIANKQRVLPVVDGDTISGVITRTDLLTVLIHQTDDNRSDIESLSKAGGRARTRVITNFLKERLSPKILRLLKETGRIAEQLGFEAYVVGGFVRDLFLYRLNEDIDVVIEGDGIAFAKAFARHANARIHTHKKFGTAVIIFQDGFKIDVASARLEYYSAPAALPDVEMSSIKLDLFRRDFTINTLAIHLNPPRFGRRIDFFSAQKDIKDKVLRVLHNLSFVEDPTRAFRAIRFEQRFGFTIGKLTASLIDNAVKLDFFKGLSGRRVCSELRQILEEENPTKSIVRMQDFNMLPVIHPKMQVDDEVIAMLDSVKKVVAWHDLLFVEAQYRRWTVYFMALIGHCNLYTSRQICRRLELAPRLVKLFCHDRIQAEACLKRLEKKRPQKASDLNRILSGFPTELILYMLAVTRNKAVKKSISHYYNKLRTIRLNISGKDLIDMGMVPGPAFRHILETVLDAKLNGKLATQEEELAYARRLANNAKNHPVSSPN